jgi:hypothetical protein
LVFFFSVPVLLRLFLGEIIILPLLASTKDEIIFVAFKESSLLEGV